MFYVYCYFNPLKSSSLHDCGFEPFYVGKGKGDRKSYHLFPSQLKRDKNRLKTNIIEKILSSSQAPLVLVLAEFESEQEAFAEEMRLIKLWGRRDKNAGPLANMTDGGEGTVNKIYSESYRKKLSMASKRQLSEETKSKISKSLKGTKQSREWVQRRSDSRKGYTTSMETRKKISDAHKLLRSTEAWKVKASLSQRGKKHSVAHIAKCVENNPRSQPIMLDGVIYPSIGQAIKITGLTPGKVRKHPSFKKL